MPYALVIFDFDGTLADSADWFRGVLNQVARRYGFREVDAPTLEALRGQDNRAIIRHLGVPGWKMPLIAKAMRKLAARDADRIPLFEGTDRLLRGLRAAGVQVALVTSNSEANARRILGPANAALVDHYACGASLFGKAASFRRVIRRAGVPDRAVLAIGDEVRDIEAAARVGIDFGAVAWGYALPDLLQARGPTMMFERMDEILPRVTGGTRATTPGEAAEPVPPVRTALPDGSGVQSVGR